MRRTTAGIISLVWVLAISAEGAEPQYSALDPRGTWPTVARIPLAKRLTTLDGKRVYLIMSWDRESGFDRAANDLAAALTAAGAKPVIKNRNVRYSEDDPALWAELKKDGADGFLYVAAASSSTTSYAFKWSAYLEKSGLPGAVLAFDQLASVGVTTNEREGAPVRSVAFSYPTDTMDRARYRAATDASLGMLMKELTLPKHARARSRRHRFQRSPRLAILMRSSALLTRIAPLLAPLSETPARHIAHSRMRSSPLHDASLRG
jgi:hypothetical protein